MKHNFLNVGLIAGLLFFGLNASAATYYLGGAYDARHCQQIAGQAGYPYCKFGGYHNGYYVTNGCFGITSNQPESKCDRREIKNNSWYLSTDDMFVYLAMKNSKHSDIYKPVLELLKRSMPVFDEMYEMAYDGHSCYFMERYFWDEVRPTFRKLEDEFLKAHYKALDQNVGKEWNRISTPYNRLKRAFGR